MFIFLSQYLKIFNTFEINHFKSDFDFKFKNTCLILKVFEFSIFKLKKNLRCLIRPIWEMFN